jgi:hypothetical protein
MFTFSDSSSEGVKRGERSDEPGLSLGEGFEAAGDVVFAEEFFGCLSAMFPRKRRDGAGFGGDQCEKPRGSNDR